MPEFAGRLSINLAAACKPPAEAPMATIGMARGGLRAVRAVKAWGFDVVDDPRGPELPCAIAELSFFAAMHNMVAPLGVVAPTYSVGRMISLSGARF
jgi:hypothetical protein